MVAFGCASAAASAASASSMGASTSMGSTDVTVNLPTVRVPVLSMHSTSTRASPSTAGISCTSTFRFARRLTATAKATLINSTKPSGTIATVPATAPVTAARQLS